MCSDRVFLQNFSKNGQDFSNIICYSGDCNDYKNYIVLSAHYDGYDNKGVYVSDSLASPNKSVVFGS